jgi:serine/threonine protein kinase
VSDVLSLAHAQGIVHRDIKPENLMLVADPVAPGGERVKVLDFGIAKLSDDRGGVKTATDQVMGTPAYMSPEQCAGAGGVDAQTDVYALGCVLYELLSGRTPFVADGPGRLIGMHLFQEPPPLLSVAPQVPSEIADLVDRMLRKDKAQRPTMKVAADELAKQLSKQTGIPVPVRPTSQTNADSDETRLLPIGSQASTIGRSIGQRMQKPNRAKSGLLLGATGVLLSGIIAVVWIGSRPAPRPATTAPATAPSGAETPKQTPPLPDLGIAQPPTVGTSPPEATSPRETAVPPKPKTSPIAKKPMSGPPTRPAKDNPAKKRLDYEE